jgi:hypothetical protein
VTAFTQWLADVLNRHIERHNVEVAAQLDQAALALIAATSAATADTDRPLHDGLEQQLAEAQRPCWACGNPVGFHVVHWPCWTTPPINPTLPTLPDGSQLRSTP